MIQNSLTGEGRLTRSAALKEEIYQSDGYFFSRDGKLEAGSIMDDEIKKREGGIILPRVVMFSVVSSSGREGSACATSHEQEGLSRPDCGGSASWSYILERISVAVFNDMNVFIKAAVKTQK